MLSRRSAQTLAMCGGVLALVTVVVLPSPQTSLTTSALLLGAAALTGWAIGSVIATRRGARVAARKHADERSALLQQVALQSARSRRELLAGIHDGPLQQVVFTTMSLEVGLDDMPDDTPGRQEVLDALAAARTAVEGVRDVLAGHTDVAAGEELPAALRRLVDQHATTFPAGASVLVAAERPMPEDVQRAAFLIAREAVVNAAKHADADTLTVTGAATDEALIVTVADDGIGVDTGALRAQQASGHLGVALMAERAAAVGGVVAMRTRPGGGTVVEVRVPLPTPDRPANARLQLHTSDQEEPGLLGELRPPRQH